MGVLVPIAYVSIPYWIYHRQVNKRTRPGAFAVIAFLLMTGCAGGLILIVVWDALRWVLSKVLTPSTRVHYAVTTPGLVKRAVPAQSCVHDWEPAPDLGPNMQYCYQCGTVGPGQRL